MRIKLLSFGFLSVAVLGVSCGKNESKKSPSAVSYVHNEIETGGCLQATTQELESKGVVMDGSKPGECPATQNIAGAEVKQYAKCNFTTDEGASILFIFYEKALATDDNDVPTGEVIDFSVVKPEKLCELAGS